MISSLTIGTKELVAIKVASTQTGYSSDHINRLAREEKIIASQIGKRWYVDVDSLREYAHKQEELQKQRQQQLSEERKREREARAHALGTVPVASLVPVKKSSGQVFSQARVLALGVLFSGVGFGLALNQFMALSVQSPVTFQGANPAMVTAPEVVSTAPTDTVRPNDISSTPATEMAMNVRTISPNEGIVLLPQGTTDRVEVTEFFSDTVELIEENGVAYVVKRDEQGRVLEKLPYVSVPVRQE